jgi:hypothetical protein
MAFTPNRHRVGTAAGPFLQREVSAYVLLEEARLRCERVLEVVGDAPLLGQLHRELGLAGFFASSCVPPDKRRESRDRAHDRCGSEAALGDDERALGRLVERAQKVVESGLTAPVPTDYMHLAHIHVLQARDLLTELPKDPGQPALRAADR